MTTKTSATTSAIGNVANRQYIFGPLAAQTISGTVKGQLIGLESNAAADGTPAIGIRVIAPDASTVRGTALAVTARTLDANNEYPTTTAANRTLAASAALSSVSVTAGDYLVIEIGWRENSASANRSVTQTFGDVNGATDLPEDQTTTGTTSDPWIEFSGNILPATQKLLLKDSAPVVPVTGITGDFIRAANEVQGAAAVTYKKVTPNAATITPPTVASQFTKYEGSAPATWMSEPLGAVTISGTVTFNIRALQSALTVNTTVTAELYRCDINGKILSTIAAAAQGRTELGTTEAANNWTATPTSTSLSNGDRLAVRVFIDDAGGTTTVGTTSIVVAGAAGATGDSYVQTTEFLPIYVPPNTVQQRTQTGKANITYSGNNGTATGQNQTGVARIKTNWFNTSWTYRKALTINNTGRGALTNFPVLVKLNSSRVTYANLKSDGTDLRFTTLDGTLLDYEIDTWNASGSSYVWVKIPTIQANSSSAYTFYMYYGNAGAADGQNKTGVWSNGYVAVYHLKEAAGNYTDSTTNAINATTTTVTNRTGDIGLGACPTFVTTDLIDIPDNAAWDNTSYTVEALYKPTGAGTVANTGTGGHPSDTYPIVTKGMADAETQAADVQFFLGHKSAGFAASDFENIATGSDPSINCPRTGLTSIVTNSTYHLAQVVSGSSFHKIYVNGVNDINNSSHETIIRNPSTGGTNKVGIGCAFTTAPVRNGGIAGNIDEVRISNVARSDDWMAATYASIQDSVVSFSSGETIITTRTQTGVANISAGTATSQTQTGKAAVKKTVDRTQTGIARVTIYDWHRTQTGKAQIVPSTDQVTTPYGLYRLTFRQVTSPRTIKMWIAEIDLTKPIRIETTEKTTITPATFDAVKEQTTTYLTRKHGVLAQNIAFYQPTGADGTDIEVINVGFYASNGQVTSNFTTQPPEDGAGGWSDQSYAIVNNCKALNIAPNNTTSTVSRGASASQIAEGVTLGAAISGSFQTVINGVNQCAANGDTDTTKIVYSGGTGPQNLVTNGTYTNANRWYNLLAARTSVGVNQAGDKLVFAVADVTGGSSGCTATELADILITDFNVYNAWNTDGGGSSGLSWVDPATGTASRLNSATNTRQVGANVVVIYNPSQTQTGKAAIKRTTDQTQTGKASISSSATTSQTQTGKASVLNAVTRTQTGKSAIKRTTDQTQTGTSRITVQQPRTQTGVARIFAQVPRTQTGVANIVAQRAAQVSWAEFSTPGFTTNDRIQTGKSRITVLTSRTQTGKAAVKRTTDQTQTGTSRITVQQPRTQTGIADVKKTTDRTQTGITRVTVQQPRTQTGIADIKKAVDQTQTGKSNIIVTGTVQQTQTGKAAVKRTTDQTQTGKSAVKRTTDQTQTGKSAIKKTVDRTQTGLSKITVQQPRTQTGIADIKKATSQTQTGKAAVKRTTTQTQTGISNLFIAPVRLFLDSSNNISGGSGSMTITYTGGPLNGSIASPGQLMATFSTINRFSPCVINGTVPIVYWAASDNSNTAMFAELYKFDYLNNETFIGRAGSVNALTSTSAQTSVNFYPDHVALGFGDGLRLKFFLIDADAGTPGDPNLGDSYLYVGNPDEGIDGYTYIDVPAGLSAINTNDRTQTGKASVLNAVTRTQTGIARIKVQQLRTQTGLSRITVQQPRTQTGIADVKKTTDRTQTGLADVKKTVDRTQSGVSNILVTASTTRTQTGKAAVKKATDQTQTGKAAVKKATDQTQTGTARITVQQPRTQTGKADVKKAISQTQDGKARVTALVIRSQTGISRISVQQPRTQTGVASIAVTGVTVRTQTGKSSVKNAVTRTQTGLAKLLITTTRTQTGVGRVGIRTSRTQTAISRVTVQQPRTQTGVSRVTVSTTRTQTGLGRVGYITARTISGAARINRLVPQDQTGIARVTAATTRIQTGKAAVKKATDQTQLAISRITIKTSRTQTGTATVKNTATTTNTGLARIFVEGAIVYKDAMASIKATLTTTKTGRAAIVPNTFTITLLGSALVQSTSQVSKIGKSWLIAGDARVYLEGYSELVGRGVATKTGRSQITGTAFQQLNLYGTSAINQKTTRTQTGKAKIQTVKLRIIKGSVKIGRPISSTTRLATRSGTSQIT
jgi:hypothetical protein